MLKEKRQTNKAGHFEEDRMISFTSFCHLSSKAAQLSSETDLVGLCLLPLGKECSDEWIQIWYIYMKYYSALRNKEILLFGTTWVKLEIIMVNKVSQAQINTARSHLYVELKKVELIKSENRLTVARF